MNYQAAIDDELAMLRATARRFVESEVLPNCDAWREAGQVDVTAWRKAGEIGLLCAGISDEFGGIGGDFRHEAVIIEELAKAGFLDFAIPLHSAIVAPYLQAYGTDEQKHEWLPRMASGDLIGAIAMTEPDTGSDLRAIRTSARRADGGYVLNGQKTYISNGQIANLVIVAARDGDGPDKSISLFAFETEKADGFRRGKAFKKIGMHAQDTSELFFDDVELPETSLLGSMGDGFGMLTSQLPQERLIIAVQAIAAIETAIRQTVEYTRERTAFGRAVFDFQNTKFQLAKARSDAAIGRVYIDHLLARHARGRLDDTDAAMAKYWITEKQAEILDLCVQLHGGFGYMAECPVARMWTDTRVHRIYGGTNEIMQQIIARSL